MFYVFEGVRGRFREGESHGCCNFFKLNFFFVPPITFIFETFSGVFIGLLRP